MMIWDAFAWLLIAKLAVLLFEDAAYAARGKQSPRLRERARQRAEAATGGDSAESGQSSASAGGGKPAPASAPATGWGRAGAGIGGYLADLVEDGRSRAQQARRRKRARDRGAQAVDGVLTEVDEDGCWYADCDTCGWSSRGYRIEDNARTAGAAHARTHRKAKDAKDTGDAGDGDGDGDGDKPAGEGDERGWTPTVIQGGRADDDRDPPMSPVVHTDDHSLCPGCPDCRPGGWAWACKQCGQHGEGFTSREQARVDSVSHPCRPAEPAPGDPASAATPDRQEQDEAQDGDIRDRVRHEVGMGQAQATHRAWGRCDVRTGGDRLCGQPVWQDGPVGNTWCRPHLRQVYGACADNTCAGAARTTSAYCWRHDESAPDTTGPAGPDNATTTTDKKEKTVNLDANGPEEIRTAFSAAIEASGEQAEEISGIAGVLTEAAGRYEAEKMAASTVGHLIDAAEAYAAAGASLSAAHEHLEAALGDFNAHDGAVADTVADTGGNVASEEILVG